MLKLARAAMALTVGSVLAFSGRALADGLESPMATDGTAQSAASSPDAGGPGSTDGAPSTSPVTTPSTVTSPSSSSSEAVLPSPLSSLSPSTTADALSQTPTTPGHDPSASPSVTPTTGPSSTSPAPSTGSPTASPSLTATGTADVGRALPGRGKRVVFDISEQRVWLVRADGTIVRSYPVSGSRYGQLQAGDYSVFSSSRRTTSWNSRATMNYMVRFARGRNAAIGFHDIPRYPDGRLAQTEGQLGTPLSDGCVRQRTADARALWNFAPVGTKVIVRD